MRMMDRITHTLSRRRNRLALLAGLLVFLFLPLGNTGIAERLTETQDIDNSVSTSLVAGIDEVTPWWNETYQYRRIINVTESNSTLRVNYPVDVYLEFEEGVCYDDSLRMVTDGNIEIPSQTWNKTYWDESSYIISINIVFFANVSLNSTSVYWLYFSDVDVGAPAYPAQVSYGRTGSKTLYLPEPYQNQRAVYPFAFWFAGEQYNATVYNYYGYNYGDDRYGTEYNGGIFNVLRWTGEIYPNGSKAWDIFAKAYSQYWAYQYDSWISCRNPVRGTPSVDEVGPLFIDYSLQFLIYYNHLTVGNLTLDVKYRFYKWGYTFDTNMTRENKGGGIWSPTLYNPYYMSRANATYDACVVDSGGITTYEKFPNKWNYNAWGVALYNPGVHDDGIWGEFAGYGFGEVLMGTELFNTTTTYEQTYMQRGTSYNRFYRYRRYNLNPNGTSWARWKYAMVLWNAAGGNNETGYTQVFNVTSNRFPVSISIGTVYGASVVAHMHDLNGDGIANVNVTLLDPTTGQAILRPNGMRMTALTDSSGNASFFGLYKQDYDVVAFIDTTERIGDPNNYGWLDSGSTAQGMNVTATETLSATGMYTAWLVEMDLATITIHLDDLLGDSMPSVGPESIKVRIFDATHMGSGTDYMALDESDINGNVTFYRLRKCDWVFNFTYTNDDTEITYTMTQLAAYSGSHVILQTDILPINWRSWTLPLTTLNVNVKSYDGLDVQGARVELTKARTSDPLNASFPRPYYFTPSSGNVTFYRVMNGSWYLEVSKDDAYGHTAWNTTEQINLQGAVTYKQIVMPLTHLTIKVYYTSTTQPVVGASVNVTVHNVGTSSDITVLGVYTTNASGYVDLWWVVANNTDSNLNLFYRAHASYAGKVNYLTVNATRDSTWVNDIGLEDAEWTPLDTILLLNVTLIELYYGDTAYINVDYYNITSGTTSIIGTMISADYESSDLAFALYRGSLLMNGSAGYWNGATDRYLFAYGAGTWNFTVTIDSVQLALASSQYDYVEYMLVFYASTATFTNPTNKTVTVRIYAPQTHVLGARSLTFPWSNHVLADYALNDTTHNSLLDPLDVLYFNVTGTGINFGTLTDLGTGYFRLEGSGLNSLAPGNYSILLIMRKLNYVYQTLSISLEIKLVNTTLAWSQQPIAYIWGSSAVGTPPELSFTITHNGTPITITSYTMRWINNDTGSYFEVQATSLTYMFNRDIVSVGFWKLQPIIEKEKYVSRTIESDVFEVTRPTTEVVLLESALINAYWGTTATLDIFFNDTSNVGGVCGAVVAASNWTGLTIDSLGGGNYRLSIPTDVAAQTYEIDFTLSSSNVANGTCSFQLRILIPLDVVALTGPSTFDPIQSYWTGIFTVEVQVRDLSRDGALVSEATVICYWLEVGFFGAMSWSAPSSSYTRGLSGSYAEPPTSTVQYVLSVHANLAGADNSTVDVYLEILLTPTTLTGSLPFWPDFYGSSFSLSFEWNDTIANDYLWEADTITLTIYKGASVIHQNLTNCGDYLNGTFGFVIDIRSLGLTVDSSGMPTFYTVLVSASKSGYSNPLAISFIIAVSETPTVITADPIDTVVWSDYINVTVDLTDTVHSIPVPEEATVYFQYMEFAQQMIHLGGGRYFCQLDTHLVFPASDIGYLANITYSLPNYVDGRIEVTIMVDPLEAIISFLIPPDIDDMVWCDTFAFTIGINSTEAGLSESERQLGSVLAYYGWLGYPMLNTSIPKILGFPLYATSVNTSMVPAGMRSFVIFGFVQNHTVTPMIIEINVNAKDTLILSDTEKIVAIAGVTESETVTLIYQDLDGAVLEGAMVHFDWGDLTRYASWSDGEYVCEFNPSISTLTAPGSYLITFHAELQNYTSATFNVTLVLCAASEMRAEDAVLESDQTLRLYFIFCDLTNNVEVPTGVTTTIGIMLPESIYIMEVSGHDENGYYVDLTAEQIGSENAEPYTIYLVGHAAGYQNHTSLVNPQTVNVVVIEPQFTIPLMGSFPRSFVILAGIMLFGFVVSVTGTVAIRRWRVPFHIKQINKALKRIESNRKASVRGIKSMGSVIAGLLAPGMAALDLEEPTIYAEPGIVIDDSFAEESDNLLGELDALDEIAEVDETEVSADFEAELAAEIETIAEEPTEPKLEVIAEEVPESEIEEPLEEAAEEITPEADAEEVSEGETDAIEAKDEGSESEHEAQVTAEESELDTDEASEVEELEPDADRSAMPEEPDDEPEMSEGESAEMEPQEDIPSDTMQLSKKELIDELLSDTTESMPEEDLKKLSKKELQALFDSMNDAEDA